MPDTPCVTRTARQHLRGLEARGRESRPLHESGGAREWSRWPSPVCAAVVMAAVLCPVAASAQRTLVEFPFAPESLLSASGAHLVLLTRLPILPDDLASTEDVYRYSIDTAQWLRVPQKRLLGMADQHDASKATIMLRGVSGDGRYLSYESKRSADDPWQFIRYDFLTGQWLLVRDASQDVYLNPTMSRDGQSFAWIGDHGAVHVARAGETSVVVGHACVYPRDGIPCLVYPSLSGDGRKVFWQRERTVGDVDALWSFDRVDNRDRRYPQFRAELWQRLLTNATGSHVAAFAFPGRTLVLDTATGQVETLSQVFPGGVISDDGVHLLTIGGDVYDRRWGVEPSGRDRAIGMSADGRIVAVDRAGRLIVLDLDGDGDGMRDPWETTFGLSPFDALDASGDDDADGVSNRDEYAARTHPRGHYRRYFAEGVTSPFFDTTIFVQRTGWPFAAAHGLGPAVVTFFGRHGWSASRVLRTPGLGASDTTSATVPPALGVSEYAVTVEAEEPFAADRLTTWPAGAAAVGAHASSALAAPANLWVFAEGTTRAGFQVFYLLSNPGATAANVSAGFLCTDGAVGRTYLVPARGRLTVWVNQEGASLRDAECGAVLNSDQPIVAERSLYLVGPEGRFTAGTSAAGMAPTGVSPAAWHFAGGATSGPFDMFLALVNPTPATCDVEVTYLLPGQAPIHRTHPVPAGRRRTIWVDYEDPRLAQADAVATNVSCPVGPVYAERAMWWRAPGASGWTDGHVERGAHPATRWALAHVPESAHLAILNTSSAGGLVRIRLYSSNGVGAAEAVVAVRPGLTTVRPTDLWPALGPDRYGATLESLPVDGMPPVPVVVERTSYAPGLTSGSTMLATPLP